MQFRFNLTGKNIISLTYFFILIHVQKNTLFFFCMSDVESMPQSIGIVPIGIPYRNGLLLSDCAVSHNDLAIQDSADAGKIEASY